MTFREDTATGKDVTFGYSDSGRLLSLGSDGEVFAFEYDDAGRMTKKTYPSGAWTDYEYADHGRLMAIWHRKDANTLIGKYVYRDTQGNPWCDEVGNRTVPPVTPVKTGVQGSNCHARQRTGSRRAPGRRQERGADPGRYHACSYDAMGNQAVWKVLREGNLSGETGGGMR